jgi:hypothetical protein
MLSLGLKIIQGSPGHASISDWRSFKDLSDMLAFRSEDPSSISGDHSRTSETSFKDLWRCLYFGLEMVESRFEDSSRISERSSSCGLEIVQRSPEIIQ